MIECAAAITGAHSSASEKKSVREGRGWGEVRSKNSPPSATHDLARTNCTYGMQTT